MRRYVVWHFNPSSGQDKPAIGACRRQVGVAKTLFSPHASAFGAYIYKKTQRCAGLHKSWRARSGRLMHACIQHDAGCWRLSPTKTNFHLAIEPAPRWWPEEPLAPPPARSRLQRKCGRNDSRMSVRLCDAQKSPKNSSPHTVGRTMRCFFLQRRLRRHNHLCIFPPGRIIARSHRARKRIFCFASAALCICSHRSRDAISLDIQINVFRRLCVGIYLGIYTDECGFSSHASVGAWVCAGRIRRMGDGQRVLRARTRIGALITNGAVNRFWIWWHLRVSAMECKTGALFNYSNILQLCSSYIINKLFDDSHQHWGIS